MIARVVCTRRSRGVLRAFALAALCASCDQPLAQVQAKATALTSTTQGRLASQIVLDFDLPNEYWAKNARGEFLLTGFLVGYFAAPSARPLHTIDVTRDAVILYDRVGRLVLPRPRLPVDVTSFVIRLQTITTAGSSEWSDPSPAIAVTAPTPERNARNNAPSTAKPRAAAKRRGVSLEDVQKHPRLLVALEKLQPTDAARQETLTAFQNLDELATAVVICNREDIALDDLSKTVKGPPRRSLRRAVRELKPSSRQRNVVQAARDEAKQLLAEKSP
jgi:hypothetical protein